MAVTLAIQAIKEIEGAITGTGVAKKSGVTVKQGAVLKPTSSGYDLVVSGDLTSPSKSWVIAAHNSDSTNTNRQGVLLPSYGSVFEVTLGGAAASSSNTAPGFQCNLGYDSTTGHFYANAAVTANPFWEVIGLVGTKMTGAVGDTNVRVKARAIVSL